MDKTDMRILLELSIQAQKKGAKAAEVSLIRSVVSELVEQLPTTVQTTSTPVSTQDAQWPVEESTPPMTQPSQHLHGIQYEEFASHVAHCYDCRERVERHLRFPFKTHAQDVDGIAQSLSTSVKPGLKSSAEASVEEYAKSLSKPNSFEEVCRESILQDSHCILNVRHKGKHMDSLGNTKDNGNCKKCGLYMRWGNNDLCPVCLGIGA